MNMRKESILNKTLAGIGSAALVIALSACAHHDVATDQYGQIRTEAPATTDNTGTTVATVNAPANTEGVGMSSTPAVISGPAAVDNTGRAYTSSSAGGTGNGSSIGTNTNVNLIPKKTSSEVVVTQSPAVVDTTVVTNSPAPVIVETPAPAPMIVETPAPAPVIVETPAPTPMISSTTETTTTTDTDTTTTTTETEHHHRHHRRMHKD
jgi:hypothetical protein